MTRPLKVSKKVGRVMQVILAEGHIWGLPICEQTGYGPGTVYPALNRLLKAGWITDHWETPADPGRPRRRFYAPAYTPTWYESRLPDA